MDILEVEMKNNIILLMSLCLITGCVYAQNTAFDSMGNATEVKLAPAINTQSSVPVVQASSATPIQAVTSIKEQKFTSAITNLDDAQVELRQELTEKTEEYNTAFAEKKKTTQNCKSLKKEISSINRNMKNIERAKKNINKNLQS